MFAIAILLGFAFIGYAMWRDSQNPNRLDPTLVRAARGNRRLAKRLLDNARQRHPGKSEQWYVEKVIYDLERDGAGSGRRRRQHLDMKEAEEKLWFSTAVLVFFSTLSSTIGGLLGGQDNW